jgi:broad specificity phosphatase PhoE
MTPTLYIVRHGNTFETGDVVTRVGGRTDLPLSVSGLKQAAGLADHFLRQGVSFATASTSPLKRTRVTAETILASQAAPPDLRTRLFLREIDYGPDEDRPEPDVLARIGEAALHAWETEGTPPPGWRVDPQALIGNWQELFRELGAISGAHLIVTSNGIARFALRAAGADTSHTLKLATGAYGVIALDGEIRQGRHSASLTMADAIIKVRDWNIRPAI